MGIPEKPIQSVFHLQFSDLHSLFCGSWSTALCSTPVQCRSRTAGLRLLCLHRPAYKAGAWLVTGYLDFRMAPTIPYLRRVSHSAYISAHTSEMSVNHMVWTEHYFLLGVLVYTQERAPAWPAPQQTLESESLVSFPRK